MNRKIRLFKMTALIVAVGFFISGCSTVEPIKLKNISYSAVLPNPQQKITTVEIKRKGSFTIVKKMIPYLKKKVAELNLDRKVIISNVKIKPYSESRNDVETYKVCSNSQPIESANIHRGPTPYFSSSPNRCTTNHKTITKQLDFLIITADVFEFPKTISL